MWHKESRGGEGRVGTTEGKYFRVKREDARPPADRMIYIQTSLQKEGPENQLLEGQKLHRFREFYSDSNIIFFHGQTMMTIRSPV